MQEVVAEREDPAHEELLLEVLQQYEEHAGFSVIDSNKILI